MIGDYYESKRAIVTGGLGFIGSNLALRLLGLGAGVTVVDSAVEGCGADERNLALARGAIEVLYRDIGDAEEFTGVLERADVVFNLAGEISHARSIREPLRDLELNVISQLKFLRTLAKVRRGARVVYASTRQVYGRPFHLPVDENHPIRPQDFNGVHKRTAELYHLLEHRLEMLDPVVLRLTNVYGPRLALNLAGQGFLSVYLRRALEGKPLQVFGDGSQLRDPLFVDDAVDAFLTAGAARTLMDRVFNVAGPESLALLEIARIVTEEAGVKTAPEVVPFPEEHRLVDIGSYAADSTRITNMLGWAPQTPFREGVRKTLEYFRNERR